MKSKVYQDDKFINIYDHKFFISNTSNNNLINLILLKIYYYTLLIFKKLIFNNVLFYDIFLYINDHKKVFNYNSHYIMLYLYI